MIDALPRRVPIGILLEYNAYSEFLTLEPLDNLPYWRVVMSFHTCCSTLRRCLYGGSLLNWCHVHSIHKVDTVPKSEIGVPIILGANHMEVATDVFVWSCRRPDPWLLVVRCPWGASDSTELRQLVGMPNDPAYRRTINSFHSRCMHWPVQASGFYTRCSESGGGGGGVGNPPSLHCISIPKLLTPHTYTRLHILLPGLRCVMTTCVRWAYRALPSGLWHDSASNVSTGERGFQLGVLSFSLYVR